MRKLVAVGALIALVSALALPAGAANKAKSSTNFALTGEARGLELAIGDQGVTLGLALAQVDSTPKAIGVGAGQCTLLGADADPNNLPCSDDNTVKSEYPGTPGTDELTCTGGLPAPLDSVLTLKVACGASKSGFAKGVAHTKSTGKVASLSAQLPVGLRLVPLDTTVEQVDQIVDSITAALDPVLAATPAEIREVLEGTTETVDETKDNVVDGLLEIIQGLDATDALKVELGTSVTDITRKGGVISSESEAAGARIGLIGIPTASTSGDQILQEADPLKNGLVIIEVGTARASATVDRATAASSAAASPALVTVKVRDITSPTPKYVEVSVAPGETVTILEGTPAESTITAADSTTEQAPGSARAAADAVRLHLLKGVNGGVQLGIASARAAAQAEVVKPEVPTKPVVQKRPPRTLPLTGARDMTLLALGLMVAAAALVAARRRVGNN